MPMSIYFSKMPMSGLRMDYERQNVEIELEFWKQNLQFSIPFQKCPYLYKSSQERAISWEWRLQKMIKAFGRDSSRIPTKWWHTLFTSQIDATPNTLNWQIEIEKSNLGGDLQEKAIPWDWRLQQIIKAFWGSTRWVAPRPPTRQWHPLSTFFGWKTPSQIDVILKTDK